MRANRSAGGRTIVLVALAVAAFAVAGCDKVTQTFTRRGSDKSAASADRNEQALSQTFVSPDKLFAIHYPAVFAAEAAGGVLALSRNLPDGGAEVLSFAAVEHPISTDFDEFTRVAGLAEAKRPSDWEYREGSRAKTKCVGVPGLEIVGNWKLPGAQIQSHRWWCAFLRGGHGYMFAYNTPQNRADLRGPLLRTIVEATTFD